MENLEKGGGRASLERMSTAELEELLIQDFRSPENGDAAALFEAAEILAEREESSPGNDSAAADQAWEAFRTKYLPHVKKGRPLYDGSEADTASDTAVQPCHSLPAPRKRENIPPDFRKKLPLLRRTVQTAAPFLLALALTGGLLLACRPKSRAAFAGRTRNVSGAGLDRIRKDSAGRVPWPNGKTPRRREGSVSKRAGKT